MAEAERVAGERDELDAIRALLAQARDQAMTHPPSARYYLDAALKRLDQLGLASVDMDETPVVADTTTTSGQRAPAQPIRLGRK